MPLEMEQQLRSGCALPLESALWANRCFVQSGALLAVFFAAQYFFLVSLQGDKGKHIFRAQPFILTHSEL